jgi:endoglucanase
MYTISNLDLLKELSEKFGPSGFEDEVLLTVKNNANFADEIKMDKLGSLVIVKKGRSERPRILIAGHADEIGFVISSITKEGFLTFRTIGGWADQVLLAQRVMIRTKKGYIHGVIASKPPHLLSPEERNKLITKDKMYIDIGATSKEEAESMGVRIGDPAAPWSPFTLNGKIAFGKAFDDRAGLFAVLETMRNISDFPGTIYGVATVQEEVGLRGAQTSAFVVEPDVAIAVDVDIAGDVPGIQPSEAVSAIGKGPSIITFDMSMIPNQRLKELAIEVAESLGIKYQLSTVSGGTDAGRFHLYKAGCPSLVIGIPTRHIHSHTSVMSLDDLENTIRLLMGLVMRLDERTVEGLTKI